MTTPSSPSAEPDGPGPDSALEAARAAVERATVGGHTVACAESLTGGLVAATLCAVPGASAAFLGGVVAYATQIKTDVLGVPAEIVTAHGVVSAECAEAMATRARALTGATHAVATTGVAGPDTQEGKPVGTVFVGLADAQGASHVALSLDGDRQAIRTSATAAALDALVEILAREDSALG